MLFDYPPPRNWDQFEELCADVFQAEWGDPALVRNGRAGQAQHGVDIICRSGGLYPVGLQCKKKATWPVSYLSTAEVDKEVAAADGFQPPLLAFYILTTAADDQTLLAHVRTTNVVRKAAGKFEVELLCWNEIVRRATKHDSVMRKHFGVTGGDYRPLLDVWRCRDGKLIMSDDELEISAQELYHDLRECPTGRLSISQEESEDMTRKLIEMGVDKENITLRRRRLSYLDELAKHRRSEGRAALAIQTLLSDRTLVRYIIDFFKQELAITMRSIVERELDERKADVTDRPFKLRVTVPGENDDFPTYGSEQLENIFADQISPITRLQAAEGITVFNVPDIVRGTMIIPAQIERILRLLENSSEDADMLRRRGVLDLGAWKVTHG